MLQPNRESGSLSDYDWWLNDSLTEVEGIVGELCRLHVLTADYVYGNSEARVTAQHSVQLLSALRRIANATKDATAHDSIFASPWEGFGHESYVDLVLYQWQLAQQFTDGIGSGNRIQSEQAIIELGKYSQVFQSMHTRLARRIVSLLPPELQARALTDPSLAPLLTSPEGDNG